MESILMAFMAEKPNDITLAAMKEAENSDNLERLNLDNFCPTHGVGSLNKKTD